MSKASEAYPTVWYTVWFWTKQRVGNGKGGLPKTSQQLALLNKYLSALHRTNLLTVVLIKMDCWWNENRLWPLCFFFSFQIGRPDSSQNMFQTHLQIFFFISTHSPWPVKLAWERRVSEGSWPNLWRRAPVSLDPFCLSKNAAPHSDYLFHGDFTETKPFIQNESDLF